MSDGSNLAVVLIPLSMDEPTLQVAVSRSREARLEALLKDPDAFASSYEREREFPMETFRDRLENPQARTFVLVPRPSDEDDVRTTLDHTWRGSVVILGPKARGAPDVKASVPPWFAFLPPHVPVPNDENAEARATLEYHIVGMFVMHNVRGRGFAKQLLKDAITSARAQGGIMGAQSVKISVLVDVDNPVALGLYQSSGFTIESEEEFRNAKGPTKKAFLMEQERSTKK